MRTRMSLFTHYHCTEIERGDRPPQYFFPLFHVHKLDLYHSVPLLRNRIRINFLRVDIFWSTPARATLTHHSLHLKSRGGCGNRVDPREVPPERIPVRCPSQSHFSITVSRGRSRRLRLCYCIGSFPFLQGPEAG